MRKFSFNEHYKCLHKLIADKYSMSLAKFIYEDCGIWIKSRNDLKKVKDYAHEIGCGSSDSVQLSEYIDDIIARKELEKKLERIRKGEYVCEHTYSNQSSFNADATYKVHL